MARKQKLKVYRTSIGFHDAYVAASSQKTALKAWGTDVDLFARGVAEAVDDEKLSEAPLKNPGIVVRVPRGSSEEHMAALPKARPARRDASSVSNDEGPPPRRHPKPEPKRPTRQTIERKKQAATKPKTWSRSRPSPAQLEDAERALECAEAEHREAFDRIREQEKALQAKRRDLKTRHADEIAKLEGTVAKARASYSAAIEKWRG